MLDIFLYPLPTHRVTSLVSLGFRETTNCFPQEIYYSAAPQQVKAYKKRCFCIHDEDEDFEFQKSGSGVGLFGNSIDMETTTTRSNSTPTRISLSSDSAMSERSSINEGETCPHAAMHSTTTEAASPPTSLAVIDTATGLYLRMKEQNAWLQAQFAEELDARLREQEISLHAQFAEELDKQMGKLDTHMQQSFNVLQQQLTRILHTSSKEY